MLRDEIQRVFLRSQVTPLLLRGTATENLDPLFERGILPTLNDDGIFPCMAIPETFEEYDIPIVRMEQYNTYEEIYQAVTGWAHVQTTTIEILNTLKGLGAVTGTIGGVVLKLRPRRDELDLFPEYTGRGHPIRTDRPVALYSPNGISIESIVSIEPITEIDRLTLLKKYEGMMGKKLSHSELQKTTLR
jgi:hypothetical protein